MKKSALEPKHRCVLEAYGLREMGCEEMMAFEYEEGENLTEQGEPLLYLLLFLGGRAKVFYTASNGKTMLIDFYSDGGIIGEAEMMTGRGHAGLSVQAMSRTFCIGIPLRRYRDALISNLTFMQNVGKALGKKLMQSTASNVFTALHTLDVRLCAYIAMTQRQGVFRETLTEVAEYLGTSYRHLLRTLERLCTNGVLQKTPQGYVIADNEALLSISESPYDIST